MSRIRTGRLQHYMRAGTENTSASLVLLLCLSLDIVVGGTGTSGFAQVQGGAGLAASNQKPGGTQSAGSAKTPGSAKMPGSAQTSNARAGTESSTQKQFEGIIQSRNRSVDYGGETQEYEMTIWVKKAQVKVTVPQIGTTPGSTVIYRTDSRVSWILNDQDRTYFEIAVAPRQGSRPTTPSDPGSLEKPVITRTNKTRKILGYLCEQVMIQKGDTDTEIWGTKKLGDLTQMLNQSLQAETAGDEEGDLIAKMALYPLQSVTRYEGRVLESQEVTKIERKSLPDDLFRIPAGYTRQKALDVE